MDLEQLRSNALAFKKAAERCMECRKLPDGTIEALLLPVVVNLAFSIELYFKYTLAKNGSGKRGHDLLELFNLLDPTIKTGIIEAVSGNETAFLSELKAHSGAFADWRYLHERNSSISAALDFMLKLANYMEKTV